MHWTIIEATKTMIIIFLIKMILLQKLKYSKIFNNYLRNRPTDDLLILLHINEY